MESEIKIYFRILLKRLWFICVMAILFCGLAGAYDYLYSEPVYEANSKVIVNSSRQSDDSKLDINEMNSDLMIIDTYKEIIATPAIMGKVVANHSELGLNTYQLISQVKVTSSSKSQIMSISIQQSSPEKAALIVNSIAEVFKEEIPKIMSVDNVTILSQADAFNSSQPISPSLTTKLAIAFILSLIVSVGMILLWEYFDDSIKTEKEVMAILDKPVLSTIARIKKSDLKKSAHRSQKSSVNDAVQISLNR
ncbi:YveK family protein [Cohnella herbarum]|uniref:Lipopolysaccharide biosynthesis protein n=1 Tax=Cohnella herbarum TaxID=2728023 RepID=A0A7Z2VQ80_9BACL|nr:Wzz/FepE/Etk N-terminal domain-containing protein [Cohnella herbarum]QJD87178.1 lipopolysaccharide biosynthesis protein [Cohnella herbarum]